MGEQQRLTRVRTLPLALREPAHELAHTKASKLAIGVELSAAPADVCQKTCQNRRKSQNGRIFSRQFMRRAVGGLATSPAGISLQFFVQFEWRGADSLGGELRGPCALIVRGAAAMRSMRYLGPAINSVDSQVSVVAEELANVEEFVQLFAQNQRGIQAYIWTLVPNRADSDDLMQETSVSLWRKWSEFDRERDFFRWACGVAFIEVLRYRRKTASQRMWFSEELDGDARSRVRGRRRAMRNAHRSAAIVSGKAWTSGTARLSRRDIVTAPMCRPSRRRLSRPVSTLYKMVARIRDRLHMCIEGTIARQSHP